MKTLFVRLFKQKYCVSVASPPLPPLFNLMIEGKHYFRLNETPNTRGKTEILSDPENVQKSWFIDQENSGLTTLVPHLQQ